jgi:Putative amidoligase enzyme
MVSPIFRAYPSATWREDVQATWAYLRRQYEVTKNTSCSTHIHISFEPPNTFTEEEIRRVIISAMHFETAFEVLVPPDRRQNRYAKSNWLDGRRLGRENKSRFASMVEISQATGLKQMIEMMQASSDKHYCWNFNNLLDSLRTIEFRKPPASTTAYEALAWTELAISFIQASVKYGSLAVLHGVPSTVGALRWFLKQAHIPGMNEPGRLASIFAGKDMYAALEPQAVHLDYIEKKEQRLFRMAGGD